MTVCQIASAPEANAPEASSGEAGAPEASGHEPRAQNFSLSGIAALGNTALGGAASSSHGKGDALAPARFWSPRRVALAMLCVLILAVAGHLKLTYDKALQDAETLVSALARAIDQHVGGSLRNVENLLQDVADAVQNGRHLGGRYAGDLQSRLTSLPEVRYIGIVNREGVLQTPTWPGIGVPEGGLDVSDRSYYTKRGGMFRGQSVLLGDPVVGKATHGRTIHMSRALTDSRGQFAGVAVAAINPDVYADFLSSVLYDPEGTCGVISLDGPILAYAPHHDRNFGVDLSGSELLRHWATRNPQGIARLVTAGDGSDKLLAYRTLPGYAVVVTAGLSRTKALADWRRMAVYELGITLAFVAILLILAEIMERRVAAMRNRRAYLELAVVAKARELKDAQALIEKRAQQISWRNAEWQRLAMVAAHHLQEPLRAVVSFSQLIGHRFPDQKRQRLIANILNDGNVFKEILTNFQKHIMTCLDQIEANGSGHGPEVMHMPAHPAVSPPKSPPASLIQNFMARGIALLICAGLIAGTFYQLSVDRRNAIRSAERLTDTVVNAIEQHIRTNIRSIEALLREAVFAVEERRQDTPEFKDWMSAKLLGRPELRFVAFAGPDGTVAPGAWQEHGAFWSGANIADQSYFQKQRESFVRYRLVVGKPHRIKGGAERSLELSLPVSGPDGQFGGIVFASVNPDIYGRFLDSLLQDEKGGSAIIALDGDILARAPNHQEKFGVNIFQSDLFKIWIPRYQTGVVHLISKADGNDKFVGYRVLSDYPIVVTSGISYDLALKSWFPLAEGEIGIVVIACILILIWAHRVDLQGQALQRSRLELARQVEERTTDVLAAHNLASWRTERLEKVNMELHQLATLISDELRVPLQSVTLHVAQLQKEIGEEAARHDDLMTFVTSGTVRLQAILRDFKRYVTLSARPPRMAVFDALVLATTVADRVRQEAGFHSAHFKIGRLPRVIGDEEMIGEVFRELFWNAIKHRRRRESVQVSVEARLDGEKWILSVSDDGPGVSTPEAEGLFRAFENAPDRDADSTGLGLPLCLAVLQTHDERIWLAASDRGAIFCFTLRVA